MRDHDDAEDLVVTKGSIEFSDVSFHYVPRYVVSVFDLLQNFFCRIDSQSIRISSVIRTYCWVSSDTVILNKSKLSVSNTLMPTVVIWVQL